MKKTAEINISDTAETAVSPEKSGCKKTAAITCAIKRGALIILYLGLGLYLCFLAAVSIEAGRIGGAYGFLDRGEEPLMFWANIGALIVLGLFLLRVAALLLRKPRGANRACDPGKK